MNYKLFTLLLLATATVAAAQETHYHKGLRSQADNDQYGGVASEPNFNGGGTYWSRVRNVDDVAITTPQSRADTIARLRAFSRLCQQAYDAYERHDYHHTILYGDSALANHYHTPDLYYMMGVSFEQTADYPRADWAYRQAMKSGYTRQPDAYPSFKARMRLRKAQEKQRKKEDKKQKAKKRT